MLSPPSHDDVLALLAEILPTPVDRGAAGDALLLDLGIDSLAFAELAAALQERFAVDLIEADTARISTVDELVALVRRTSERRARTAGERGIPAGIGRLQRPVGSTIGPVLRWWFDVKVEGAELVPATGPVILCMNHESLLDIPVAVLACPRPVTFMAKRELFRSGAGARFFHELGGFSVDRDGFDLRAIEIALQVLDQGSVLGMYPEGTRKPGELLPFLPGAAWLALRTGATLQPAAILGTELALPRGTKVPKRVPISVRFGSPIRVEPVDDPVKRRVEAERLTGELRASVRTLLASE